MAAVRRACRWSLYHAGKWYCKLPAVRSPGKERPKPLDEDGCPDECDTMDIVPWKVDLFGEDYADGNPTLNEMPIPVRVLEWEDET